MQGGESCIHSMGSTVQRIADIFKSFGVCLTHIKFSWTKNLQLMVHCARRVSAPRRSHLEKELDRTATQGVMRKTPGSTPVLGKMEIWEYSWINTRTIRTQSVTCQVPMLYKAGGFTGFLATETGQKEFQMLYLQFSVWPFLRPPFGLVWASEIAHKELEHVKKSLERISVYTKNNSWCFPDVQCCNHNLFTHT